MAKKTGSKSVKKEQPYQAQVLIEKSMPNAFTLYVHFPDYEEVVFEHMLLELALFAKQMKGQGAKMDALWAQSQKDIAKKEAANAPKDKH